MFIPRGKAIQAGNLLTESQSGFRSNHSTSTALISAVNLWLANMDAGKLNGSVFIDLKKAFDTVDHNILPRKLYCYGVNGNALQLRKSYSTHRTQRCYVNESYPQNNMYHVAFPRAPYLDHYCSNLYKRFSQMSTTYNAWYVCR